MYEIFRRGSTFGESGVNRREGRAGAASEGPSHANSSNRSESDRPASPGPNCQGRENAKEARRNGSPKPCRNPQFFPIANDRVNGPS